MLILGGLLVVALFAALIGPYFINWDDYKATFEAEAEKILGQPVRVKGSADASLLPSPSFTFTNLEVGDSEGRPMMTVDRFTATIELMPLLQGEIRVVAMKLERPRIAVSVADGGVVDWLIRTGVSGGLDPEKVALEGVEIVDGVVVYNDAASGIAAEFHGVTASIEAKTLAGPWRIEGSYRDGDAAMQFQFATGRRLADGTIQLRTELTPGDLPLTVTADGLLASGDDGLTYAGTFATEVVATEGAPPAEGAPAEARPAAPGLWRSEGSFDLKRGRITVNKAVLSFGSPDRPVSLAGSMIVDLGKSARFQAAVQARQLDLDRLLGKGPSAPIDVGAAARRLVASLDGLAAPIPGSVAFSVPAIVVGGAVIQEAKFLASSQTGGWQITGLHARLPGQASLDADGMLSTAGRVGFGGTIRLAVAQPANFAAWWRGGRDPGGGRQLAPFDLAGRARLEVGRIAVEGMETKIGGATITGSFAWNDAGEGRRRLIETDLAADRLDFGQIRALAELLLGRDLSTTSSIADSYAIKLSAGELAIEDVVVRDISVDAGFVDGTVTVNKIDVGDLGGAKFVASRGTIVDVFGKPSGKLSAQLEATSPAGLARLADRIAPGSGVAGWLAGAGPALAPVSLGLTIEAPPQSGGSAYHIALRGNLGQTTIDDATLDLAGAPSDWRNGKATFKLGLSSVNVFNAARQFGLVPVASGAGGSARLSMVAEGVPKDGLKASAEGSFAGFGFRSEGILKLVEDLPPAFAGTFEMNAADLDALIRMADLRIPGGATGTPLAVKGKVEPQGEAVVVTWTEGSVANRRFTGKTTIGRGADRLWRVDGDLSVDAVDLDWIAALGLGFAPLPTGDPAAPWSTTPFAPPAIAGIAGKLNVAAGHLTVSDDLDIGKAALALTFAPDRIALDATAGEVAGGKVTGGLSIHNVGGNVDLAARFDMKGVALDRFMWRRGERPIATGVLDLSADIEATGRSPAGLVATITGGGALSMREGELRYVNPRAAMLVVRASDLGQQAADESLGPAFEGYFDGGNLPFGEGSAAFSIAAGTVRLKSLTLATDDARLVGGGNIDLSTLTLDSDWTLTLDPGDQKGEGGNPQVGLLFNGPVETPSRTIDVLPFASYLNIRQTERIQEILILEEAARMEKDRFSRERRKLREDAVRREREEKEATAARVAAVVALEDFHVRREEFAETHTAVELAAAQAAAAAALMDAADRALAEKAAADRDATAAANAAALAEQTVAEAETAVVETGNAEQAAIEALATAERRTADAKAAADAAALKATTARAAADEARRLADGKISADAMAKAGADKAIAERTAAAALAKTASEALAAAEAVAKRADADAAGKVAALAVARRTADDAETARQAGEAAAAKAAADQRSAEEALELKVAALSYAGDVSDKAAAEKASKEAEANAAATRAGSEALAAKAVDDALAAATAAADAAAKIAASAAAVVDNANAAARFAAETATLRENAAAAARAAVGPAQAEAAAKRDEAGKADAAASEARAALDAVTAAAAVAAAGAARLKAEAEAAAVEAAGKAAAAERSGLALAEAQKGAEDYARAEAAAIAKANAAVAEAQSAVGAATAARQAAAQAGSAEAAALKDAADVAERASALATALAADAKAAAAKARDDVEFGVALVEAAEENAAGPRAQAAAAAQTADAAAKRAAEADAAATAAAGEVEAKRTAYEATLAAAESARAAAKVAGQAFSDATAKADAEAMTAASAREDAAARQAPLAGAAAERTAADAAAADKLSARDKAVAAAAAQRTLADKAAAEHAAAAAAASEAEARAGAALNAVATAAEEKAAAEKAVADAVEALAATTAELAKRTVAAEKARTDLAAAEADASQASDAAAVARAEVERALAAKDGADQVLAQASVVADSSIRAARALAPDLSAAEAAARRAEAAASSAGATADAAARTAAERAAAEAAARDELDRATAERMAAEKAMQVAAAAVPPAQARAKEAAEAAAARQIAAAVAAAAAGLPAPAKVVLEAVAGTPPTRLLEPSPIPLPPPKPSRLKPVKAAPGLPSQNRPLILTPVN